MECDIYGDIQIPKIFGNFDACADSVYQALFPCKKGSANSVYQALFLRKKGSLGSRLGKEVCPVHAHCCVFFGRRGGLGHYTHICIIFVIRRDRKLSQGFGEHLG